MVSSRCPKCKVEREILVKKTGKTAKGMNYVSGNCCECGTIINRFLPKDRELNQSVELKKSSVVDLDRSEESD